MACRSTTTGGGHGPDFSQLTEGPDRYLIMGLGYLRNSSVAVAELRSPSGILLASREEEFHDDEFPLRFKVGLVLGFSSRIGIELGFRADVLFGGFVRDYYGFSQAYAKGGLFGVDAGIHFNL